MQFKVALLLLPLVVFCGSLRAQEKNCSEVAALAGMARAKSIARLVAVEKNAGDSYRAQIVFHARMLELDPKSRRIADSLLELIPTDEEQKIVLITLGDSLCDSEPMRDMAALDRLGERIAHDFAIAVLLAPQKMQVYVAYSYVAADDPHSDYAVQMQRVCRVKHSLFLEAVNRFGKGSNGGGYPPTPSRDWFSTHIFDPNACRALVLPEAE
jgi:hypothetical protein